MAVSDADQAETTRPSNRLHIRFLYEDDVEAAAETLLEVHRQAALLWAMKAERGDSTPTRVPNDAAPAPDDAPDAA